MPKLLIFLAAAAGALEINRHVPSLPRGTVAQDAPVSDGNLRLLAASGRAASRAAAAAAVAHSVGAGPAVMAGAAVMSLNGVEALKFELAVSAIPAAEAFWGSSWFSSESEAESTPAPAPAGGKREIPFHLLRDHEKYERLKEDGDCDEFLGNERGQWGFETAAECSYRFGDAGKVMGRKPNHEKEEKCSICLTGKQTVNIWGGMEKKKQKILDREVAACHAAHTGKPDEAAQLEDCLVEAEIKSREAIICRGKPCSSFQSLQKDAGALWKLAYPNLLALGVLAASWWVARLAEEYCEQQIDEARSRFDKLKSPHKADAQNDINKYTRLKGLAKAIQFGPLVVLVAYLLVALKPSA